ncbi:MAG: Ribosome-recycling factor [Candidatus Magasanikbacteria bacterium]|nr:Ribosome-recycling factor [Candidatus Magasanikbacteria bacterium]
MEVLVFDMPFAIDSHRVEFEKILEHLKMDLSTLRTGRASPLLVEQVMVEAYGSKMPLKGVASINVPDAKTLAIDVWDKGLMKAVEEALRAANLGINPVNDGKVIRMTMPQMTEETRKNLIKVMHGKLEDARIAVRQAREDVRQIVKMAEDGGEIGEDEKFALQQKLEDMVKEYNEKIKTMGESKEKEIMTI